MAPTPKPPASRSTGRRTTGEPRNRPRPRATLFARTWWIAALIVLLAGVIFFVKRSQSQRAQVLTGYLTQPGIVAREFQRYFGRPLNNPDLETRFLNAEALTIRHDYTGAAAVLEGIVGQAPVPAVYNNLGVLYAEMNDRGHALNAFRDGFTRDGSYAPIRHNMDRLKELRADSDDPVTEEIEPNGTVAMANPIAVGKAVEGSIAANRADEDTFRFVTPPAPRDVLALQISNVSADLIPGIRVYDIDNRVVTQTKADLAPGSPLTHYMSPQPNTTLYLQVSGLRRTAGSYVLTVQPLKAFDQFEPDDVIFNAHRIALGIRLEANIMDAEDTDFYEFTATRTGFVTVEIENRSTTLIPALTTFSPDRRNTGFGPDLRTPGASLTHRMEVQQNQTYFIQVWSQGNSSGAYAVKISN